MIEIIQAVFRPEVLIFLIPITGIIGGVYLKAQKLKVAKKLDSEDKRLLEKVLKENDTLKTRIDNLESIVTGLDDELLTLKTDKVSNTSTHSLH